MASHPGDTSQKPLGLSTHSFGHSPSALPSNVCHVSSPVSLGWCSPKAHSQGKLIPATAPNMFGVGIGASCTLKGLNSGWQVCWVLVISAWVPYVHCQVWGSTTPASKMNTSTSSAASVHDLSPSQGESMYCSNIRESWITPRPSSGTWDEMNGSPQKEFSQLVSWANVSRMCLLSLQ